MVRTFENISGPAVPRASSNLAIGAIVGPYRIVEQIGCGSMGIVYEAAHPQLGRPVAIKVLHSALVGQDGMDTRMLQEASILDELQHPGVTEIFDYGLLDDRRPWIAMELVTGESLACKLSRVGTLTSVEVCNLIAAIADVLAAAAPLGIVHRDLKPENVLFADASTGFPLRVIDWGVARLGPAARLTAQGVTCGTPIYMSPEQMKGSDIAPACDIYSLGVIAYEALCGTLPVDGRTLPDIAAKQLAGGVVPLSERVPAASGALCELVHTMLASVPGDRPTAVDVREIALRLAIEITLPIVQPRVNTMRIRRPRWTPQVAYAVAGEFICPPPAYVD